MSARRVSTIRAVIGCQAVMLAWLFFLFGLGRPGVLPASQQSEVESFLEAIQVSAREVDAFASDFSQEKQLELFSRPVRFTGQLYVERPDRLRWEFRSPVPSVLILDGERGIRCNNPAPAEFFNLTSDPIMALVADQLWLWLSGNYQQLAKRYTVSKSGDAALLIKPIDDQSATFIASVTITFDTQTLQPREVYIAEPGGDHTRIIFSNIRLNPQLPAHLFTGCNADG